jgi:hypothetical protein
VLSMVQQDHVARLAGRGREAVVARPNALQPICSYLREAPPYRLLVSHVKVIRVESALKEVAEHRKMGMSDLVGEIDANRRYGTLSFLASTAMKSKTFLNRRQKQSSALDRRGTHSCDGRCAVGEQAGGCPCLCFMCAQPRPLVDSLERAKLAQTLSDARHTLCCSAHRQLGPLCSRPFCGSLLQWRGMQDRVRRLFVEGTRG